MTKPIFTLTDSAAAQIKTLMAQAPAEAAVTGLRIGVQAGGCSGMRYFMEYAAAAAPGEEAIEEKGVKIFIDPSALLYLVGTEMDFISGEFESGFVFKNPNETGRCGCGKSFSAA